MPAPALEPFLLTPNALRKALAETPPTKRQNWALNRGGDVDVLTLGAPNGRTVLRLNNVRKLTPEIEAELLVILQQCGAIAAPAEEAPAE